MASEAKSEIDEGLYSRQIYALGADAMVKMQKYSVLVSGLNGVGVEVAKNLCLAGMKRVSLHDDKKTALSDLSSQFYLTEDDVGKPRAAACISKVRELNGYVSVDLVEGDLTQEVVDKFNMVVLCGSTHDEAVRVNGLCAKGNVHFIATDAKGLMGYAFVDLGDEHEVLDRDGENAKSGVVVGIEQGEETVIVLEDGVMHDLEDGQKVKFENVEGMVELNEGLFTVKVLDKNRFSIGDTASFGKYTGGGYWTEVKQPFTAKFKRLEAVLAEKAPEAVPNFIMFDRPSLLFAVLKAIWFFERDNGRMPSCEGSDNEAIVAATKELFDGDELGEANEKIVRTLARASSGNLNPFAAMFGGIVGQEVVKAASHKFTPLSQWLFWDAAEALPETPVDTAPIGSRYDGQIAVFGKAFQEKLGALRYFLIGAGALGCEFLKNFALMGVACGPEGHVLVTDMDSIEKSNLNRQFLFRPKDVGQMKSTSAAAAAKAMNPAFNIEATKLKVAPETESKFDDDFWTKLSGVCNALDNLKARQYVDTRCVTFKKSLLESGTLGTKCHTQVILPGKTVSFNTQKDQEDHSIPLCTVKSFPNQIEHTLHWAREQFDRLYETIPAEAVTYLDRPDYLEFIAAQRNSKLTRIKTLYEAVGPDRPKNFEECIFWARKQFEIFFVHTIKDLLKQYPLDQVNDGVPFWSAAKRPPTPESFDAEDSLHFGFIDAAANIFARTYGIPGTSDRDTILASLAKAPVPEWVPTSAKIAATEEEAKKIAEEAAAAEDIDATFDDLAKKLPSRDALKGESKIAPEEFEKDVDENRHIDFLTYAGNIRGRQYKIPVTDRMQCKKIAGRIIPALATTTAACTGLIMLELYKIVADLPIEAFRDSQLNLAINSAYGAEPLECPKNKYRDVEWTLWDSTNLGEDVTNVEGLKAYFEEQEFEVLDVVPLTGGESVTLWSALSSEDEEETMSWRELFESVTKKPLGDDVKRLLLDVVVEDLACEDPDDDDAREPRIPPVWVRV